MEQTFAGDSDDEDGISDKDVLFTKLPWANIEAKGDIKKMRKECLRLANHENSLLKLLPQLKYAFEFDFDKYVFLAIVISKFYPDLE